MNEALSQVDVGPKGWDLGERYAARLSFLRWLLDRGVNPERLWATRCALRPAASTYWSWPADAPYAWSQDLLLWAACREVVPAAADYFRVRPGVACVSCGQPRFPKTAPWGGEFLMQYVWVGEAEANKRASCKTAGRAASC